jgi:hypothetical protein
MKRTALGKTDVKVARQRRQLNHLRTLAWMRGISDDRRGRNLLTGLLAVGLTGPEAQELAPWLSPVALQDIIDNVDRIPGWEWTSSRLGDLVELTDEERERGKLWSLRPCDVSWPAVQERRRQDNKARAADYSRAYRERVRIAKDMDVRSAAVFALLSTSWKVASGLAGELKNGKAFRTADGREIIGRSLRMLINRELDKLAKRGLIETKIAPGIKEFPTKHARVANHQKHNCCRQHGNGNNRSAKNPDEMGISNNRDRQMIGTKRPSDSLLIYHHTLTPNEREQQQQEPGPPRGALAGRRRTAARQAVEDAHPAAAGEPPRHPRPRPEARRPARAAHQRPARTRPAIGRGCRADSALASVLVGVEESKRNPARRLTDRRRARLEAAVRAGAGGRLRSATDTAELAVRLTGSAPSTIIAGMGNDVARATAGSPIGRSDRGTISGTLKIALDLVVNEGLDPYEAAAKVGYHARSMRMALAKRHVLAYLRKAREDLRAIASAQNIHHAIEMRANSSNEMAKLGAMRLIERLGEDDGRPGSEPLGPGLQIVIVQGQPPSLPPRTIDITPRAPAPHEDEDTTIFRPPSY